MENKILFFLNGKKKTLKDISPKTTVLEYVRSIGLTGTKLGCGEGGCGACTVMISKYYKENKKIIHKSVNGCLMPICAADGCAITTIEGLGNTLSGLGNVQETLAKSDGSQCGFCTPGFVVALHAYIRSNPKATAEEIEHALDGNLCRCTGYRPIIDAAKSLVNCNQNNNNNNNNNNNKNENNDNICPSSGKPCNCKDKKFIEVEYDNAKISSYLIFPPSLKKYEPKSLFLKDDTTSWYRPTTLEELLELKSEHTDAKLVVGNTELGIEVRFKNKKYPVYIDPTEVKELSQIKTTENGINIGAAVTLTNIEKELKRLIETLPEHQTRAFVTLLEQFHWFAGNQIRNVACLGGNLCTASPISDINPILMAMNSDINIIAKDNSRRVVNIHDFFLGYRKINLKEDEVVESIAVPFTRENEYVHCYKQSRRRGDDIAIVTTGIRVLLEKNEDKFTIKEIGLGFGGMAPTTVFTPKTEEGLLNEEWNQAMLDKAYKYLEEDLPLDQDAPGGMIQYRRSLTTSFFFKFYFFVLNELHKKGENVEAVPDKYKSILDSQLDRGSSSSTQKFELDESKAPVHTPQVHQGAFKQVSGEAIYTSDIDIDRGLYGVFVKSSKAHAKILSVDPSEALEVDGVEAYISADDIVGENDCSVIPQDRGFEQLFATEEVYFVGQPIGVIVATSQNIALEASNLVKVEYEELPHILTIKEAIEQEAFFPNPHFVESGNVEESFANCEHVIEGEMEVGGQEHFYLEPQNSYVIPGEGNEIKVYSSTQNPTKTQVIVSRVLDIPNNKVVVAVKRLGGGFGGKETRSCFIAAACSVCAFKLRKPVHMILERCEDMSMTGLRHPFVGKYKVGFNSDGNIQALDIKLYNNAGFSLDLSESVMDRALFHVENTYNIPNVKAIGYVCRTNTASNTAFRGFGGPQSMIICETYIDQIAQELNKQPEEIRKINFYKENDKTHYNQVLNDVHIDRLWDELYESSEYQQRTQDVEEFNKNNRWKKRGISMVPVKFGMSFTAKFLNQAGALVHVYVDGSVLVTHGATEMGQGVYTKITQIAAHAFGIDIDKVYISETSTDKVPNTSPTAASVQADMNGMAVLNACNKINDRLQPYRDNNPNASFPELVHMAYFDRVNLSANGFYRTPDIGYEWDKPMDQRGNMPFNYFCWGSACCETEVDVLTGDFHIIRTDILMDVGKSLNPHIDIGQVEGAFIQGLGWCTLEQLVWFSNGKQFTTGPGTYKIPCANDVPLDFRVSLLSRADNKRAVHSSKGVGEPPFFLSASAFFANKKAIYAARKEYEKENISGFFDLYSPSTCERIRVACKDQFTDQFNNNSNIEHI